MSADNRVPVWLDCDPGHDDAFAILLAAYSPHIRLLGVSTVFGNADIYKTTNNALSLITAIGKHKDITVVQGAGVPQDRPPLHAPTGIHGETGLDGTDLMPKPLMAVDTTRSAVDAMAQALRAEKPGTAWLTATGSMTNAAALFRAHPDLKDHVAGVSVMGGAVGDDFTDAVTGLVDGKPRIGNWTPYAEFNVIVDPEAAASIFHDPILSTKTTIIPLDLTHLCLATPEVQKTLLWGGNGHPIPDLRGKTTLRAMLVDLLTFFAQTYRDVFGITEGPPLHDPLAVAAVLVGRGSEGGEIPFFHYDPRPGKGGDPSRRERFAIEVVTAGTHEEALAGKTQTGRTIVRLLEPGAEGITIPRGLDIPLFWQVIEECCERADEANEKLANSPAASNQ